MSNILLVNPWIYDFSAYNLGIKPVGLLLIGQYLKNKSHNISLVDCLDGASTRIDEYGFSKIKKTRIQSPEIIKNIYRPYFRYGISLEEFSKKLDTITNPDIILITSVMTYWYPGIKFTIKLLKERFRNVPVVLGGIYATLCYEHALENSGADAVYKGSYLNKQTFINGNLYPAYELLEDKKILPIQLTKGCPFHCSYCASNILSPEFLIKDPTKLFDEVCYYENMFKTKCFVFYDDAIAFQSSIGLKKFLQIVIKSKKQFMFFTPNSLHARFLDEELAELMKKSGFRDIRLSLETSDTKIQFDTSAKVTNDEIKKAVGYLKSAGFGKKDIGVYTLIGAPWLDADKTLEDINFVNSLGAKTVLANFSPIPGTRDFENLVKNGIFKNNTDPLWHNHSIFAQLLKADFLEKIRKIRHLAADLNKT